MNIKEMHIGVKIGVQKVDSNAYDTLLPEEIDYYLNKGSREYIRRQNIYLREDLDDLSRPDLISDHEAVENLGSLLKEEVTESANITDSTNYDNGKEVSKPADIFSYVYGQVKTDSTKGWRACKLISTSEMHLYSKTDYNDPIFRRYPIVSVGDKYRIFYDAEGDNITKVSLMYISQPSTINYNNDTESPDLPFHTHDDIVDIAVGMIAEDIKSARPYEQNQTTTKGEDA